MRELTVKKRSDGDMAKSVSHSLSVVAHQVTQLYYVITCLRTVLNKDLPIQNTALIFAVVQQPGINMQGLMEGLGLPQSSVSRNMKLLSGNGRGYGLLRNEPDLVNRK
jgi:DNA-binding MarR family transcriptional regulator